MNAAVSPTKSDFRSTISQEAPLKSKLLFIVVALSALGMSCNRVGKGVVEVGGHKVELPGQEWRAMPNEAEYARNFEAVTNTPPRQYQVVTFFLIPMTEDRRSGQRISPTEYLEVFLSNPGEITVLLKKDHGSYWLLSREMFRAVLVPGIDTNRVGSFTAAEAEQVAEALRNQIDSSRYLVSQRLVAR